MSYASHPLTSLTIENGGTNSNALAAAGQFAQARALLIVGPSALTGTVKVYGSTDGGTNYNIIQDPNGTDVTVVAAKSIMVNFPGIFTHIRVTSGSAEGAERVMPVRVLQEMP
jgi:restriction endonuclease Mrr